ncbi:DNA polymerase III subunit chi [Jannaschia seosinensis]|uniref:DNA polymerase III subunit chi n=1 Tax=Jannaschia seosinensis TaxID=313367 RepID=A0A0M7BCL1_9RHOB|nr:DNA polymerase III subunit chi [Jannaschia seosinensis]CUH39643.1 DNA polymerase III subunit chi [Jannaschia seosinensis]
MGDVYFYHLTNRSVEEALTPLLTRALAQGWRVALRGRDAGRLDRLDAALWQGPNDAFLPHGRAGGPHDSRQPVLLTTGVATNDPVCLMGVDGAEIDADEVTKMTRTCILFDGLDGDALSRARTQWKALTDAGCSARYWSEESGKWEEKASRNV